MYPIDHHSNRFEPKVSFLPIDLSTLSAQHLMDDLVHQMRPLWIHCGIPCGTASRARQLPISSRLKALGVPTPRPLRSAKFPLGLPDLTTLEAAKVESASAVYRTCVRVLFAAYKVNSIVSIENPARAWTWAALAALVVQFGRDNGCPDFVDWYFNLHDVFFSMCMHGGQRKKDTRLKSSPQIFSSLAAQCDGSHSHEPYGQKREGGSWKFDTAAEAQYPRVLCLRMVKAASQAVAPAMFADTSRRFRLDSLAALGEQTVKHPPLIPEYRQVVWSPTVPSQECKLLPDYSEAQCDVAINHAEVPSWPVPLSSTDLPTRVPLDSSATEKLAWTLLQQKHASKDDLLELVSLLPRPHHSRRQAQALGLSWIAGAYVFSSEVGLHSSTRTLPFTTCLLAQVLLHFARGIVFSSLAVFADFAGRSTGMHITITGSTMLLSPSRSFSRVACKLPIKPCRLLPGPAFYNQAFFIGSYPLWSARGAGGLHRSKLGLPPSGRRGPLAQASFQLACRFAASLQFGGGRFSWRSHLP